MHPAQVTLEIFERECEFRTQRRSGPGGQHRNKVETGVFARHRPTGIEAGATESRSQAGNRESAIRRLRVKLAIVFRSSAAATLAQPSATWTGRCRGRRIQVNENHFDFAALLSEALDTLAFFDWNFPPASEHLQCSNTQLIKLLSVRPTALDLVNVEREKHSLPPLRRR